MQSKIEQHHLEDFVARLADQGLTPTEISRRIKTERKLTVGRMSIARYIEALGKERAKAPVESPAEHPEMGDGFVASVFREACKGLESIGHDPETPTQQRIKSWETLGQLAVLGSAIEVRAKAMVELAALKAEKAE